MGTVIAGTTIYPNMQRVARVDQPPTNHGFEHLIDDEDDAMPDEGAEEIVEVAE